jgi:hypothetical protein
MREMAEAEIGGTKPAATEKRARVRVSVVVLVSERPDQLEGLYEEYAAPLRAHGREFEFVFVSQPWHRRLMAPLADLARRGEPLRLLEVSQPAGEAILLKLAVAHCSADIVVTLPAYRRVQPEALLSLIDRVDQGADVAVARRWPRRDSWVNRLQNRAFHALVARLVGGRIHDVACGVQAMSRTVVEDIPLYGDFFRFLPLLALRQGYRVEEVPSPQHDQDLRTRLYGPGVYIRRLIDVFGLYFLVRFIQKPLRFFGLLGALLSSVGVLLLGVLFVQRLLGQGIADRPLLLLAVLMLVMGIQAIALGLVGEIIVHLDASRRSPYRLARPERTSESKSEATSAAVPTRSTMGDNSKVRHG